MARLGALGLRNPACFELGDACLECRELLARACEHLYLHVVFLAAHQLHAREGARQQAAEVLLQVLRGIGGGHLGQAGGEVAQQFLVHDAFAKTDAPDRCLAPPCCTSAGRLVDDAEISGSKSANCEWHACCYSGFEVAYLANQRIPTCGNCPKPSPWPASQASLAPPASHAPTTLRSIPSPGRWPSTASTSTAASRRPPRSPRCS